MAFKRHQHHTFIPRTLAQGWLSVWLCASGLALLAVPAFATDVKPDVAATQQWTMFDKYCNDCHNVTDWAGSVAFDTITHSEISQNAETMEHVVRKLRGRLMPPPGKPQPSKQEIQSFVSWMETSLDSLVKQPDPGHIGVHRLNRKEYANAVRDLFDINVDPVALLPRDDTEDGFDNVAHALQVSPSFLDQYIAAARIVATQAIGNPRARPVGATYTPKNAGTQLTHRPGLPLGTRGGIVADHYFPADGEYVINIGNMAQALWVTNMEFKNTVLVTVDGVEIYRTDIGGEEDMRAIDQLQDPAVDAINKRLKNINFKATAGTHKLGVTFLRRTFSESEDRLSMHTPGGGQDRLLRIGSFEIRGPFNVTGVSESASRKRIFTCYPTNATEEAPCAQKIIANMAPRAYRRPVTAAEVNELMRFYEKGRATDFETGVRMALTAMLASPDFLYRSESGIDTKTLQAHNQSAPGSVTNSHSSIYPISDLDLASRLSFFLWSSVPDEELLSLAAANKLRDSQVLKTQVMRMLADKRADTLVTNFAFQWLNIPKLQEIEPDGRVFPYATGAGDVREDFREELRLFISSVFREDRNILDLLTANHTFVNERLALHYDITTVKGERFQRITLPYSARYGLLGKGAILTLSSYPTRTAPVLRGAWIMEHITGTPPAAPPPGVEALKVDSANHEKPKTLRALMEMHATKANCHSCHGVLDPLGLALENFDASGKYRELDRFAHAAIDSTGTLPDGTNVRGPDDLRKALTAQPDQFVQTVTEKMLTYALGRTLTYKDMPTVRAIVRQAGKDNYRFSSLVMNVIASDAFQKRHMTISDVTTANVLDSTSSGK
jgi:mono/diheme cytochrome c family protein